MRQFRNGVNLYGQKIPAAVTILMAVLVCSLIFSLTAFAEEYPVINTEDVKDCENITDTPLDGAYENYRYELEYYQNGVGYTGIAIVDGEEWQFENGTALNGFQGSYSSNFNVDDMKTYTRLISEGENLVLLGFEEYGIYINGKRYTGLYTKMEDGFLVEGHLDSFTDKNGNTVAASKWCYAENGYWVCGWYGPEDYKRYYYFGDLCSEYVGGCFYDEDGNEYTIPESDKHFFQGLLANGIYVPNIYQCECYIDGERYLGHHQITDEDLWISSSNKDAVEYWKQYIEVGKTYLFLYNDKCFSLHEGFYEENGCKYWYEKGLRQGTEGRGKEIYDPESDAWYWLDAVDNGKVATSKDVYQESYAGAYADREDGTGKWVRYDAEGHMIKGWNVTDKGTYYFDPETGAMAKGTAVIDGKEYTFDRDTGILKGNEGDIRNEGTWVLVNGTYYWYENGVRQGYDPDNPDYRGKEIYDPESDAWYWLDNIQQGAKAVSKDVYQESWAGQWADREDGTGKWVRYDENGHMVKGVDHVDDGGKYWKSYYFDLQTGAMVKGKVSRIVANYSHSHIYIDSDLIEYIELYDETDGHLVETISEAPYTGDREAGSVIKLE